jgi:hypothetical protein
MVAVVTFAPPVINNIEIHQIGSLLKISVLHTNTYMSSPIQKVDKGSIFGN